jgi:hypothetical protein
MCVAYMGIDPHFTLWNYFFRIRRPQDHSMELTISTGVVIHAKTNQGTDHYFDIPVPKSMKGW